MSFAVSGASVSYVQGREMQLLPSVPVGFWRYTFSPRTGSSLTACEYDISHGAIYGKSEDIAGRIVEGYTREDSADNLGVLLAGGKGLGKSLTMKLVVERLKDRYPVIIVDSVSPDLSNFLSHIDNAVVLMDEFEKVFRASAGDPEEENSQPAQYRLLSLFDGVSSSSHVLYLLSCNQIALVDSNFIARPGRIRYVFRFESLPDTDVTAFLQDTLLPSRISDIPVVQLELARAGFVSFDILQAVADELNAFPDIPAEEGISCLNIFPVMESYYVLTNYTCIDDKGDTVSHQSEDHIYGMSVDAPITNEVCGIPMVFSMHDCIYDPQAQSWSVDMSKVIYPVRNSERYNFTGITLTRIL